MKIAVISDIHSNALALSLALEDVKKEKCEQIFFLGDYLTDGPNENEIINVIQKYGTKVILGNREKYLLNYDANQKDFNNYRPIYFTYHNLEVANLNYLKSLPSREIVTINNYKILLIHGEEYGHSANTIEELFDEYIAKYDFDICLFGHTHKYFQKEYQGKLFINPGSIGVPTDTPYYKYVILDITDKVTIDLKEFRVKDTYEELAKEYKKSSYYQENFCWSDLILRGIKDGKDYTTPFIKMVREKLPMIDQNNPLEFNQLWQQCYDEFIHNYNQIDYEKLDKLFKDNQILTITDLYDFCHTKLDYGWLDIYGHVHYNENNNEDYILQSPLELMESRVGICWDYTELYRQFFNRLTLKKETYLFYYEVNSTLWPSHSIFVYYVNKKVYWFEPMLDTDVFNYSGIHEYNDLPSLLQDAKKAFLKNGVLNGFLPKDIDSKKLSCYKYREPKYHLNDQKFYEYVLKGEKINI